MTASNCPSVRRLHGHRPHPLQPLARSTTLLIRQLTRPKWIAPHPIRPQRTPNSSAFAYLGNLATTAIQALGANHSKDRPGNMANLPKIPCINQARIAPDGLPVLR
jgi:hypothetical protein